MIEVSTSWFKVRSDADGREYDIEERQQWSEGAPPASDARELIPFAREFRWRHIRLSYADDNTFTHPITGEILRRVHNRVGSPKR